MWGTMSLGSARSYLDSAVAAIPDPNETGVADILAEARKFFEPEVLE